jgi:hypothetical protein
MGGGKWCRASRLKSAKSAKSAIRHLYPAVKRKHQRIAIAQSSGEYAREEGEIGWRRKVADLADFPDRGDLRSAT